MRILLTSHVFWPHVGGVEVLSACLVGGLRRRGHDVLVITDHDQPDAPEIDEVDGVQVVRIRIRDAIGDRDPGALVAARRRFEHERARFGADLEHIYFAGPELTIAARARAREPLPTVFSFHQTTPAEMLAEGATYGDAVRRADWITACSRATLDALLAEVPELRSRSSVVANALPPPAGSPPAPPPPEPTVLMLGRLDSQKGFDLGLEAIARLRSAGRDARAIVAGDGRERAALEAQAASLGIADAVEFLGWVEPADVGAVIERASVVAMPSRFEPFGLVALQAAQFGRPLVGSAIDGLAEAVSDGETGLLTPPGDVPALAGALARILDDPELAARLGAEGRRRTLGGDDWRRHLDQTEEIYDRVTASAKNP